MFRGIAWNFQKSHLLKIYRFWTWVKLNEGVINHYPGDKDKISEGLYFFVRKAVFEHLKLHHSESIAFHRNWR